AVTSLLFINGNFYFCRYVISTNKQHTALPNQTNIFARTRTYAGKVTAGETMSRVKVVIDYN
ncbi:hypothetical protein V4S66_25825, partial [Citrobacter freundii]